MINYQFSYFWRHILYIKLGKEISEGKRLRGKSEYIEDSMGIVLWNSGKFERRTLTGDDDIPAQSLTTTTLMRKGAHYSPNIWAANKEIEWFEQ